MAKRDLALMDFDRAVMKAFWRKVRAWMLGETNELLPFDQVRSVLASGGQHYIGMKQVELTKIVGSMGRYRDFDRAFLPLQTKTKDRWINIDLAHYEEIVLPPVELYKMGEIYFVKDGNHRVSVARERGQEFIDAYVIEIDVPIPLDGDIRLNDLSIKKEYAEFLVQTHLTEFRPDARLETNLSGQYHSLLEHIAVHRWYLGEQHQAEVPYIEAVLSWYDDVYLPLVEVFREQGILKSFPNFSEADLYLWFMQYQAILRQTFRDVEGDEISSRDLASAAKVEAGKQLVEKYPEFSLRKLVAAFNRSKWADELMLAQERAAFLRRTDIHKLCPEAEIETSLPGQYDRLLEHIAVHRWYLGVQRGREASYSDAVISWYRNVYEPLVKIIREQEVLTQFPGRKEADLYLWIISRQWILRQAEEPGD